jgi:hypothetical protein
VFFFQLNDVFAEHLSFRNCQLVGPEGCREEGELNPGRISGREGYYTERFFGDIVDFSTTTL